MGKYKSYTLDDVKRNADKKLFTHISTFTGGGGSTTGLKLAGANTIYYVEFVERAIETYTANYGDTPHHAGDIRKWDVEQTMKDLGIKRGDLDLFEGSPPCSAFSMVGSRESGWGKEKNYSTNMKVENIEDLFFDWIECLDKLNPKVAIAENVQGISVGKAKEYLKRIVTKVESLGYIVTWDILKACDYGTPQTRPRFIMIAVREDIAEKLDIHPILLDGEVWPEKLHKNEYVTIGDALKDFPYDPDKFEDYFRYKNTAFAKDYKKTYKELYRKYVEENGYPEKVISVSELIGQEKLFSRYVCHLNWVAPTLTVKDLQSKHHYIYEWDRPISDYEAIRIMGLPDDYINLGLYAERCERIGRMVAPKMYEAIGKKLYENIFSKL